MRKTIISGDITQVRADALVTAINSGGMWFGGIDGAIQRAGGNRFHTQASQSMPLSDNQSVFAKGVPGGATEFKNVVFVVDDLKSKLRDIIVSGLKCADENKAERVSIPAIRTGVMKGAVEATNEEVANEVYEGVIEFQKNNPDNGIMEVVFVVYNDSEYETYLKSKFN